MIKRFIRFFILQIINPILFVKKPDKNVRIYQNYRNINNIIIKNKYFLLFIKKTLNLICNIKYFFKINVIIIFNKIQIKKNYK